VEPDNITSKPAARFGNSEMIFVPILPVLIFFVSHPHIDLKQTKSAEIQPSKHFNLYITVCALGGTIDKILAISSAKFLHEISFLAKQSQSF